MYSIHIDDLNAEHKAGEEQWQATIDGQPWEQPTFPYQARCLQWIRQEYAALGNNAQGQVNATLAGTGCEALLA